MSRNLQVLVLSSNREYPYSKYLSVHTSNTYFLPRDLPTTVSCLIVLVPGLVQSKNTIVLYLMSLVYILQVGPEEFGSDWNSLSSCPPISDKTTLSSTMLRYASLRRLSSRVLISERNYASKNSAKRALSKEQLKGEKPNIAEPKSGSPTGASKGSGKAASTASPATPDPSVGGGNFMLPVAIALTGAGAAWYFNLIPGFGREMETSSGKNKKSKADEPQTVESKVEKLQPEKKNENPISPEKNSAQTKKSSSSKDTILKERDAVIPEASSMEATKELLSSQQQKSSETLRKAHQVLRDSVDESLFSDLENLTAAELRIRVVQLGTEMADRTKWEAVRLKEFMTMKEKEVGEK